MMGREPPEPISVCCWSALPLLSPLCISVAPLSNYPRSVVRCVNAQHSLVLLLWWLWFSRVNRSWDVEERTEK